MVGGTVNLTVAEDRNRPYLDLRCLVNAPDSPKQRPHNSHLYGLSPASVTMTTDNDCGGGDDYKQILSNMWHDSFNRNTLFTPLY